jgi:DNA processing protein
VTSAACDACLRRTDLVAAVAGSIDVAWRERRGRTARVLALRDEDLLALDPSAAPRYATFDADRARARVVGAGLVAVCRCAPEYPERLRELPDPPAVLHVGGSLGGLPSGDAVAIVGARRATPYGLEVSRSLGRALTAAGLPVVSGMALGIDSAAHLGALEGRPSAAIAGARPSGPAPPLAASPAAAPRPSGPASPLSVPPPAAPPVAVLAGGAETAYPARMRGLHARLVEAGAVVSEMPPGFTGRRWCFPARNRIIAALATATVVVEAATRSGSLITADLAADLGRIVAAVPGPVTSRASAGANELLHAGAAVIRGPRDVLDLVLGADAAALAEPDPPLPPLDPGQRRLLDAIERGRGTLAELATTMEEARAASRSLSQLELLGLVRRGFGGRYVRCP